MFDKKLWKEKFEHWPSWPCPSCGSVALSLQKSKDKLLQEETGPSKRAHAHEAWEPDWIEEKFATILQCHNPACGELVSVAGNVSVEADWYYTQDGDQEMSSDEVFKPLFFDAAPPIFAVPKECPVGVKEQLVAAFSLIWCDLGATANRLRAGVEALLDDQGVVKTTVTGGKRQRLTTHSRIEKFVKTDSEAAKYLMAIKWLGNTGSHGASDAVSREDLLDAMALFEAAVDRLYLRNAEKFARMAAAISKRKGKPSRLRAKKK